MCGLMSGSVKLLDCTDLSTVSRRNSWHVLQSSEVSPGCKTQHIAKRKICKHSGSIRLFYIPLCCFFFLSGCQIMAWGQACLKANRDRKKWERIQYIKERYGRILVFSRRLDCHCGFVNCACFHDRIWPDWLVFHAANSVKLMNLGHLMYIVRTQLE